jgi:hypothetical protein
MGAPRILALTAAAALGLAGCNDRNERVAGGICTPFADATAASGGVNPPGSMAAAPPDASTAVDDCLHRWGYSLARSEDDAAETIAAATVAACASALSRWNQQTVSQPTPDGGSGPTVEAPSLLTGEQTTPIAEHYSYAQGRALFYVVQARAGNCPAPRMENGAPAAKR